MQMLMSALEFCILDTAAVLLVQDSHDSGQRRRLHQGLLGQLQSADSTLMQGEERYTSLERHFTALMSDQMHAFEKDLLLAVPAVLCPNSLLLYSCYLGINMLAHHACFMSCS